MFWSFSLARPFSYCLANLKWPGRHGIRSRIGAPERWLSGEFYRLESAMRGKQYLVRVGGDAIRCWTNESFFDSRDGQAL